MIQSKFKVLSETGKIYKDILIQEEEFFVKNKRNFNLNENVWSYETSWDLFMRGLLCPFIVKKHLKNKTLVFTRSEEKVSFKLAEEYEIFSAPLLTGFSEKELQTMEKFNRFEERILNNPNSNSNVIVRKAFKSPYSNTILKLNGNHFRDLVLTKSQLKVLSLNSFEKNSISNDSVISVSETQFFNLVPCQEVLKFFNEELNSFENMKEDSQKKILIEQIQFFNDEIKRQKNKTINKSHEIWDAEVKEKVKKLYSEDLPIDYEFYDFNNMMRRRLAVFFGLEDLLKKNFVAENYEEVFRLNIFNHRFRNISNVFKLLTSKKNFFIIFQELTSDFYNRLLLNNLQIIEIANAIVSAHFSPQDFMNLTSRIDFSHFIVDETSKKYSFNDQNHFWMKNIINDIFNDTVGYFWY